MPPKSFTLFRGIHLHVQENPATVENNDIRAGKRPIIVLLQTAYFAQDIRTQFPEVLVTLYLDVNPDRESAGERLRNSQRVKFFREVLDYSFGESPHQWPSFPSITSRGTQRSSVFKNLIQSSQNGFRLGDLIFQPFVKLFTTSFESM